MVDSGAKLERLKFRTAIWDVKFREYVANLQKSKPTIVMGDMNVARMPNLA